jgi:DNA-binding response OmpR family regulator
VARIAIVDDDADFLEYMADALSDMGYEVLTSSDSLTAPTFLREKQPDVAILDVRIGTSEGGWEICSFLQRHPATHHIPIIICSAATDVLQERKEWLRDHEIAVLEKPFDIDVMYAVVQSALAHGRALALKVSTA